ncbi:hypothetical protein N9K05_03210 [Woeseiaceae bacterium]|nr:hypothetical protein [Woeseiaceae bacterium]
MMTINNDINQNEIEDFLKSWKDGVIDIGRASEEGNNYQEKAKDFIEKHYAFDLGKVLFKPTYTKEIVFRNNPKAALSYFIGNDISEDSGFALKPWRVITTSDINILMEDNLCAVMGVLKLKSYNADEEDKIAFTFILVRNNAEIKIKIHHSSVLNQ